MKRKLIASLILVLFPYIMFSQETVQKSINVTVYNSDLGVIKDIRTIELKKGASELKMTDVAERIDPTSVHIKLDGEVIEQNYQYDLASFYTILNKYIDKEIELFSDKGAIKGTLLSAGDEKIVLRKNDGGLIMLPKIENYQISVGSLPEGLITRPTLVWLLNSNSTGKQDVELSYQTYGMNWHAEYVAVLNENDTKMDLNAWVSVENTSGATYKNAVLKLIAGDVNCVKSSRKYEKLGEGYTDYMVQSAPPQFEEKAFFEYHIYNLQRPATIANNETKQISLFETENINITKKYLYNSPSYGDNLRAKVVVEFDNKKENNLGIPMPRGKVRLNKSDGKTMEFIGEDLIDHTPKDEKVKLNVGEAFDIVVEELEKDNKLITDKVNEITYEIKIKNRKEEDIIVDVERYLGGNWEMINSSLDYEKKDSHTIIFKAPVKKGKETILTFKVRYRY